MANQEQVDLLKQGIKEWTQWRTENPDVEINLSEANLQNASLYCFNLEYANLENAALENAGLSYANLYNVTLKNANLYNAELYDVKLNFANLDKVDLRNANLEHSDLHRASFKNANLENARLTFTKLNPANLKNARLGSANLCRANLEDAIFENADLSNTFLIEVNALKTSFKGATLTGACIADWHINSKTNFEDVVCDYIYLKWDREKQEPTERRPSDPNRNFAKGEFTKLFQQARETVDLIFSEGIDWQAFLTSYQNVQLESDHGELDIRAIEKSPDGSFVIRVEVPEDTNKADLESQFYERYEGELKRLEGVYQQQLQAKDREIDSYRRESANMTEIAKLLASRPITVEAKAVAGDNIKQSGNFGIGHMSGGEIQSGAKVAGVYNEAEKQNLQTAACEIQSLLDQLDKDYGNQTAVEKMAVATEIVKAVDKNTKLKTLLTSLKSGSMAALDSFLDHPAASFVITFLDTWHQEQLDG